MATLRSLILSFAFGGAVLLACAFLTHGLERDSEYPDEPADSREIVASNHEETIAERAEPTTGYNRHKGSTAKQAEHAFGQAYCPDDSRSRV